MKISYKNQQGRTMIETLSVLGLMGILTMGAIYGFEEMLNKHKANELWNELKSRAMTLSMQNVGKVPYNLNEYNKNVLGATIELVQGDNDTFSMVAKGVPEKVCLEMLKNAPAECIEIASTTIATSTDTTTYTPQHIYPDENRDTVCTPLTDTLNLVFTYNSDLGTDSVDDSASESETETNNQETGSGGKVANCKIQDNETDSCLTCVSGYKKASDGTCESGDVCHANTDCGGGQICVNGSCGCSAITNCIDQNYNTCACTTCSGVAHCGSYTVANNVCVCSACEQYYYLSSDKKTCTQYKYVIGKWTAAWDSLVNATNNSCPDEYRWVSYDELADINIFADDSERKQLWNSSANLCYGCQGTYLWTSTDSGNGHSWCIWYNGWLDPGGTRRIGLYALCVKKN